MKQKSNNQGSTIVLVIVAFAIVGILAAVALWVSLSNFRMKVNDAAMKDSFYSAEVILDEISVGLQKDVSQAYAKAYEDTLVQYSVLTEDQRIENYTNRYINTLRNSLMYVDGAGNADDQRYSLTHLTAYVSDAAALNGTYSVICTVDSSSASMVVYADRITLKGLQVTYTDSDNYTSIIETDLNIYIPGMNFTVADNLPETFKYSIIANSGLTMGNAQTATVKGNVYAGCKAEAESDATQAATLAANADNLISINIPIGSNLTLTKSDDSYGGVGKYLIADGNIFVGANGAGSALTVSDTYELWAENINVVNASAFTAKGKTYVQDDMTLSGDSPSAIVEGEYYGYGNDSSKTSASSAIVLNGKNSTLNMSNINKLMVAGSAFIKQNNEGTGNTASDNAILMGRSIALKGDQVAYLIPGECIGTIGDGANAESLYSKNPITKTEAAKLAELSYTDVNGNVVSAALGKSLNNYITNGSLSSYVKKVYKGDYVYYYFAFPEGQEEQAEKYYQDYYGKDVAKAGRLDSYIDFYSNQVLINGSASIYSAGSYTTNTGKKSAGGVKNLKAGSTAEEDTNNISDILTMRTTYDSLSKGLVTNFVVNVNNQDYGTVFDNLILKTKVTSVTNAGVSGIAGKAEYVYTSEDGSVTTKALVLNNATTYSVDDNTYSLIIATGDVRVATNDFKGTIIALGTVKLDNGALVVSNLDETTMKNLLYAKLKDSSNNIHEDEMLAAVFRNGRAYLTETNSSFVLTDDGEYLVYSDIIKYQNWTKK